MGDVTRTEDDPRGRLTGIAATVLENLAGHPDYREGDKAIVMLDADHEGGIGLHGWEDDAEAAAALFVHLQAIVEAGGGRLEIIFGETGTVTADD